MRTTLTLDDDLAGNCGRSPIGPDGRSSGWSTRRFEPVLPGTRRLGHDATGSSRRRSVASGLASTSTRPCSLPMPSRIKGSREAGAPQVIWSDANLLIYAVDSGRSAPCPGATLGGGCAVERGALSGWPGKCCWLFCASPRVTTSLVRPLDSTAALAYVDSKLELRKRRSSGAWSEPLAAPPEPAQDRRDTGQPDLGRPPRSPSHRARRRALLH